jgi:uncharacterized membrane protein
MAIGRRRILSTLLTISLALNLFVIGIFITVVVLGGGRMPVRAADPWGAAFQASPAFMELELQSRQLAFELFQENRKVLRKRARTLRQAQRGVVRTMAADPFDLAAANDAFHELRLQTGAIQMIIHNYLVDLSRSLPDEERRSLSRSIFRALPHRIPLAGRTRAVLIPAG